MQSYSFYPNYAKFFRNVRYSCCLHRVEASVDNHGKRDAVALAVHARYLDHDLLMELHGVERRGHEALAELRDVHKAVLVDANVDEGAKVGYVGYDARQDHSLGKVVDGRHALVETERLKFFSRVASGFVELLHDVEQGWCSNLGCGVTLYVDSLLLVLVGNELRY